MNGNEALLMGLILCPALCGGVASLIPANWKGALSLLLLLGTAGCVTLALPAYGREIAFSWPWVGWGLEFALRLDHFSGFILLSAAVLSFLVAVYTVVFAKGKPYAKPLYAGMLLTLAMVNGAVLADNLAVMLFFWEAILATMFVMIKAGGPNAYKTSVKAVVIAGVTDLCMMLGIGLAGYLAGTLAMGSIRLPLTGWGFVAFAMLAVGAVSKAGSMPFHTWIPDAADDAPTPFLPFLPGALEKLLGIYLLVRICLDFFTFEPGSPASYAMMLLGAGTILFAVMMALIQRDFKRLLAYHAVSQVGYMILGIGTGLSIGIVGGLFHMLNNAIYKCCLFLIAGAVERQTGTTNLNVLGGLRRKMPVTAVCFLVAAASIAGFPMTNGFFSKELILDAALESGWFFFAVAAIGAFFTAVSFLKLGHAVFFGPTTEATKNTKEAPWPMLLPMALLAAACLALGLGSTYLIERVLQPVLGALGEGGHIGGHTNWVLVAISVCILLAAALDHFRGFKRTGKGIEAADHFHHAPVLRTVYGWAEKKYFDPYEMSRGWVRGFSMLSLRVNDGISRFYDVWVPRAVGGLTRFVKWSHNGSMERYVVWVLGGAAIAVLIFLL